MMSGVLQDCRHALRLFGKHRTFAAIATLTLALGIAATTAVFTVVDTVLLRALPYPDAERLAVVMHHSPQAVGAISPVSFDTFQELRAGSERFEQLGGQSAFWDLTVVVGNQPERIGSNYVSASLLPLLGVAPVAGRWFRAEDDQPGARPTVILGQSLYERLFGANLNLNDKVVTIDGVRTAVVGVMPSDFRFLVETELWLPLSLNSLVDRGDRGVRWITMVGRLAPGVTLDQARSEMTALTGRLAAQYPNSNAELGATVTPLREEIVGNVRPAIVALFAAISFVFLIACANVANLLLAQVVTRRHEIAVRSALGAGRVRLLRQFLAENLTLTLLGGSVGVLLALWLIDLLRLLAPADLPRLEEVTLDMRVLLFTLGLCIVTAVSLAILPVLAQRYDLAKALRQGGRDSLARRGIRLGGLLTGAEAALAILLMIGAGLLLRSFAVLLSQSPGFDPDPVLTLRVNLPTDTYGEGLQQSEFFARFFERLEALPEVEAAGGSNRLPLTGSVTTTLEIDGQDPQRDTEQPDVEFRRASGGYFRAMRVRLQDGRLFDGGDALGRPGVAIVNSAAASLFWPGQPAVGRRVRFAGAAPGDPWLTIVGVVGDVRQVDLGAPSRPAIYLPLTQQPRPTAYVAVRAVTNPDSIAAAVRATLQQQDRNVVIYDMAPMRHWLTESVAERRFGLGLISLFSLIALFLSAVGIFGVTKSIVSQRTREIGLRLALGASRRDILRLVAGSGMFPACAGLASGLLMSIGLMRAIRAMLFEVSPTDPLTLIGTALLFLVMASVACYLPARNALTVDPLTSLRND